MKRIIPVVCVALATVSAYALEFKKEAKAEDPAVRAARMKLMMEKTGGIVERLGEGKVVIINAQKKVSRKTVEEMVAKFKGQTRFNIELRDGEYAMYTRPDDATVAIVIADDPALPLSVVAVENLWGLVNVAKLGTENVDLRFTKMFIRVSTITLGGSISQFKGSALNPATSAEMLDKYVCDNYTIDNVTTMVRNIGRLGVTQSKRSSYRKACQEGWASVPTNDYQKVIWEEIHAKPTNPMKIEFDPKKGE